MEVVLAVLLFAVIMGMVLGVVKTSLELSQRIVEKQNEEMEIQALFDFMGQRFATLPGNARMELLVEESSSHYLSDLTLQNVPMSFTWGGEERIAKTIQLSTVKRRSGFLDVVLRFYEDEILEGSAARIGESSLDDAEPFAEIVLMSDLAYFEWQVLNSNTMEWQYVWEEQGRLPLQMELLVAVGAHGEEIRHVFWLPPKQSPEIAMRQLGGFPVTPASPTSFETRDADIQLDLTPDTGGGQ